VVIKSERAIKNAKAIKNEVADAIEPLKNKGTVGFLLK
jgi:hypothetical protein